MINDFRYADVMSIIKHISAMTLHSCGVLMLILLRHQNQSWGKTNRLFIALGTEASMTNSGVLFLELYNKYYVSN